MMSFGLNVAWLNFSSIWFVMYRVILIIVFSCRFLSQISLFLCFKYDWLVVLSWVFLIEIVIKIVVIAPLHLILFLSSPNLCTGYPPNFSIVLLLLGSIHKLQEQVHLLLLCRSFTFSVFRSSFSPSVFLLNNLKIHILFYGSFSHLVSNGNLGNVYFLLLNGLLAPYWPYSHILFIWKLLQDIRSKGSWFAQILILGKYALI